MWGQTASGADPQWSMTFAESLEAFDGARRGLEQRWRASDGIWADAQRDRVHRDAVGPCIDEAKRSATFLERLAASVERLERSLR